MSCSVTKLTMYFIVSSGLLLLLLAVAPSTVEGIRLNEKGKIAILVSEEKHSTRVRSHFPRKRRAKKKRTVYCSLVCSMVTERGLCMCVWEPTVAPGGYGSHGNWSSSWTCWHTKCCCCCGVVSRTTMQNHR